MKTHTTDWITVGVIIIVLALTFTLLIFSSSQEPTDNNTIKIGVLAPLTGPAAYAGDSFIAGINAYLNELDDQERVEIKLIFEDNKNNAQEAVNGLQNLLFKNIDIVIGTTGPGTSSTNPILEKENIPHIMTISDVQKNLEDNQNSVLFYYTPDGQAEIAIKTLKEQKLSSIGFIYMNNDFGIAALNSFKQKADLEEIKVVEAPFTLETGFDFRTLIAKLNNEEVDVLYVVTVTPLTFKQLKELGIDIPIFSNSVPANGGYYVSHSEAMEGVFVTSFDSLLEGSSKNKILKEVISKNKISTNSEGFVAVGYDTMKLIYESLERNNNPKKIVNTISNFGEFQGLTGDYNIDSRGIFFDLKQSKIMNGKLIEI